MAKLYAFGFNRETRQDKWYSKLPGDIISGSIPGNILCNLFLNFFYFILLATRHNNAEANTIACFRKTIKELQD